MDGVGDITSARRDLVSRVAAHYHRTLKENLRGQGYLTRRGLSDPDVLAAFQVGYADGSLLKMSDPDTMRALQKNGLVTVKGRELFAGCVVFPLTLPDLGVVDLVGRHVRRKETPYLQGPRRGVFHWKAMKASPDLILVGSVIDALSLYQVGIRNVSAVCGPVGFTTDLEELLQRFRVRRVLVCLGDDDEARRAASAISQRLHGLGIEAVDRRLPGLEGPSELLVRLGPEAAAQAIRGALAESRAQAGGGLSEDLGAARIDGARPLPVPEGPRDCARVEKESGGGWGVQIGDRSYRVRGLSPDGLHHLRVNLRVDFMGRMHVETLDLYSRRSRSIWVREASRELDLEEANLLRDVNDLVEVLEGLRLDLRKAKPSVEIEIPDTERQAALRRLRSPNLLEEILADFGRVGFVGDRESLAVTFLATVSRLLDDPLGILIVSRSGSGKSSLQDAVCDFVPEESLARHTRVTSQALFYGAEDSLVHRVLSIDEERGTTDASYPLRVLQSAQQLSIVTTEADPQTGRHRAQGHKVRGPVAILLSTASPAALDFETRNRFVQVSIDESAEQTRRILERQREMDTLEGVLARQETVAIRRLQRTMQRLLRPIAVVNPFATRLRYPDRQLQMRREHRKYLTLIRAIALLHQHQREVKRARRGEMEIDYIEVLSSDIAVANELARAVLGRGLDELAPPARDLLREIVRMAAGRGRRFTRQDVKTATGRSDWSVREYLEHLVELEYVVRVGGGNGQRMTYELVFDGDPEEDRRYLAGLVDLDELLKGEGGAPAGRM